MSALNRLGLASLPSRLVFVLLLACPALPVLAEPYNPYADGHDPLPPVKADGTLHWGPFYKSSAVQKKYEQLWNLGACRGTNKRITIPVERNTLIIDNLPEESFTGHVRGTAGSLAGGMVAFTEGRSVDPSASVLIAQLHPAGVTQVLVAGQSPSTAIKPGMTVRLRAQVDDRGRSTDPVEAIDIVTPPHDFKPDPVRPDSVETIVGTVVQARATMLQVRVDAGRIRRLTLTLAEEPRVTIVDASDVELIAPGDEVEVTGRRWSGEGAMGAGTVFASRIVVTKAPLRQPKSPRPGTDEVGTTKVR